MKSGEVSFFRKGNCDERHPIGETGAPAQSAADGTAVSHAAVKERYIVKKSRIIAYLIAFVVFLGYVFFEAPNLNPLYPEGAILWCVVITVCIAIWLVTRGSLFHFVVGSNGQRELSFDNTKKLSKAVKLGVLIPWGIVILVFIGSSVLFQFNAYRNQLTEPQERTFDTDVQVVDVNNVPVVDKDLAEKLADKKLGEKTSLGSQVETGEPVIQQVNGKLMWVVPLEHSGFFKWFANLNGTPGYITVSANNMQDVQYVDGKNIKIQPKAYLLQNLNRYARLNGGLFTGMTDYSFEIDDEGTPYWVISTYKNTRGFSLPEATGAIIVNATTGETHRYTIDSIPSWVDRIQPEEFVMTQINNRGEYINGILNFSNKDKFRTSPGDAVIYNNGRCYLYTGLTSVGKDDSIISFMMVDMITKEVFNYKVAGATENAARASAEGKVQNLKYNATFPLILNIEERPTYFMTLKDAEGLVKQYAYVSLEDYSVVGTGETMNAALENYRSNLMHADKLGVPAEDLLEEKEEMTGTVLRIASELTDKDTVYKIILKEQPDKIYRVSYLVSDELALTIEGDRVTLTYTGTDDSIITASGFDNLEFTQ